MEYTETKGVVSINGCDREYYAKHVSFADFMILSLVMQDSNKKIKKECVIPYFSLYEPDNNKFIGITADLPKYMKVHRKPVTAIINSFVLN